jgi:histidyl-tRNA synthetase
MLFILHGVRRHERPQAGRYREFTQLGFEYLCAEPERAAAFSVDVATGFLDSLGVRYDLDRAARRGLSYYLGGQGFETALRGARRPAADRGRCGAYREGAGFGIGLERLVLAMSSSSLGQLNAPDDQSSCANVRRELVVCACRSIGTRGRLLAPALSGLKNAACIPHPGRAAVLSLRHAICDLQSAAQSLA